jgi:hypothetical protein
MAIQILGDGNPDGTGLVSSASEKLSLYGGTAVVQAANITTQATSATTLTDGTIVVRMNQLVTKFNTLLTNLRSIGLIASS